MRQGTEHGLRSGDARVAQLLSLFLRAFAERPRTGIMGELTRPEGSSGCPSFAVIDNVALLSGTDEGGSLGD